MTNGSVEGRQVTLLDNASFAKPKGHTKKKLNGEVYGNFLDISGFSQVASSDYRLVAISLKLLPYITGRS